MAEEDVNIASLALSLDDDGIVTGTKDGVLKNWSVAEWARGRYKGIVDVSGASVNLIAAHEGCLVTHTHTGAATFVIPTDTDLNFPVRGRVTLQRGNAQITVTGAPGVTIQSAGRARFRVAESCAFLVKKAPNIWVLTGDTIA